MFLTTRRFMYQQVYFHRTVRAIDLDLADVFGPSIRAIFGAGRRPTGWPRSPTWTSTRSCTRRLVGRVAKRVAGTRDRATAPSARRSPRRGGRSCCAGRPGAPRRRCARSTRRAAGRTHLIAGLGPAEPGASRSTWRRWTPGRPIRARPMGCWRWRGETARTCRSAAALATIPAYWLVARRYRRVAG